MYSKIIVPVDLAHAEALDKAISTTAQLARLFGASAVMVGVTAQTATAVARTPAEFQSKLNAYAAEKGQQHGITFEALAVESHDPTADLRDRLLETIAAQQADLVVMASHLPGAAEYLVHANAGAVAAHSNASVFIVR